MPTRQACSNRVDRRCFCGRNIFKLPVKGIDDPQSPPASQVPQLPACSLGNETRSDLADVDTSTSSMTASIIFTPCGGATNERKTKLFHGSTVRAAQTLAGSD